MCAGAPEGCATTPTAPRNCGVSVEPRPTCTPTPALSPVGGSCDFGTSTAGTTHVGCCPGLSCETPTAMYWTCCASAGDRCTRDEECCSVTCLEGGVCAGWDPGGPCYYVGAECCSGVCGSDHTCQ